MKQDASLNLALFVFFCWTAAACLVFWHALS